MKDNFLKIDEFWLQLMHNFHIFVYDNNPKNM